MHFREKRKVLITGGAGFIGSHLASFLASEGYEVAILDNFSSGKKENLVGLNCKVIKGDILDENCLSEALEGAKEIYHLAGYINAGLSFKESSQCLRENIEGTAAVLEMAGKCGVKRLVLASSAAVYGDQVDFPISENAVKVPKSPYGLSKLAAEQVCWTIGAYHKVETVALRFFNVFGSRQNMGGGYSPVIVKMLHSCQEGEGIEIHGDGKQTRDFIYVEDLVRAMCFLMEKGMSGEVYNVGYGEELSILSLAEMIRDITGARASFDYKEERLGDIKRSIANIGNLQKLGWRPDYGLERGLKKMISKGI